VSSSSPAPATHLQEVEEGTVDDSPSTSAAAGTGAAVKGSGGYETQSLVDQYVDFHFPASSESLAGTSLLGAPENTLRFPQRVAQLLAKSLPAGGQKRAIDIGCAVGGSSFELAACGFDEVLGIDFSAAFIRAAQQMQRGEDVNFKLLLEGEVQADLAAQHEPNVDSAARGRVSFRTGDACRIKDDAAELGTFDGAILANLLCRLPDPSACLDGLEAIMKPGGAVVIATPFSWLEDFTPKSKWLGGYLDASGNPVHSKDALRLEMEKRGFEKIHEEQMPLFIREHRRKGQYIVSEATVWRRR